MFTSSKIESAAVKNEAKVFSQHRHRAFFDILTRVLEQHGSRHSAA